MATLLYRWKFDEGTGQYAYDSVANVAAKMYESTEWDRGVQWDAGGYNGACLKGNGTNVAATAWESVGALVQDVTLSTPPTNFSLTLWYKTSVSQGKVLACINADGSSGVGFNGSLHFRVVGTVQTVEYHYWPPAGGSSVLTDTSSDPGIADGEWHFVAVIADGTNTALYWDACDTQVDSNATVSRTTSGTFRWRIGGGDDALSGVLPGTFDGLIDDVRIYDGALTPSEICDVKADFAPPAVGNALMFSCNT